MRFPSAVLPLFLLANLATAQGEPQAAEPTAVERLWQPQDAPMRAQAAKAIAEGLAADKAKAGAQTAGGDEAERSKKRLADLRVLAATAMGSLPEGSRAQLRASEAIVASAAKEQRDGAQKAVDSLRLALSELAADLRFEPVREAELPKGFPDFTALDEIELREYPAYRMVKAPMKRSGSMGSFWMLFNHIKKNEIAMTTPVQVDYQNGDSRPTEQSMAFLYGDPAIGKAGLDGKVEVVDVAAMTALTVGARGYERRDVVDSMRERLERWLAANAKDYEATGPMRLMNYNSPSVGDDRRCFEVQIPVRKKGTDAAPAQDAKN